LVHHLFCFFRYIRIDGTTFSEEQAKLQAEDRVHRIGQADHVLVQYLVARGTSDDIMWPMLETKLDTLNKAGLSKDDFREADSIQVLVKNKRIRGNKRRKPYKPLLHFLLV